MNNEVLLDKLSEFLMVEQCGWQLYRVVGERTNDPELRKRYREFGQETDRHRTILTGLIRELGGDPDHVSPTARLAQAKSEALLQAALVAGPLGEAEREASDLENVLLAETKDHADWELLGKLASLSLQALLEASPPDPTRLDRCVIQPELKVKEVHAAPIDKRSLSDGAKLPSAQETPASGISPG